MSLANPYAAPPADAAQPAPAAPVSLFWSIAAVFVTGALGAVVGMTLGALLAVVAPGYYRAVFPRVVERGEFEPLSIGVGLGLTQGAGIGLAVGVVLVGIYYWREVQLRRLKSA